MAVPVVVRERDAIIRGQSTAQERAALGRCRHAVELGDGAQGTPRDVHLDDHVAGGVPAEQRQRGEGGVARYRSRGCRHGGDAAQEKGKT